MKKKIIVRASFYAMTIVAITIAATFHLSDKSKASNFYSPETNVFDFLFLETTLFDKAGTANYIGCFKDTSDFDLNGFLERSRSNTPQRCIGICQSKGFKYAGVQYGESCLCGNSYGKYGAANNCNYRCTGDNNQICGGYSANSIYSTGAGGGGDSGGTVIDKDGNAVSLRGKNGTRFTFTCRANQSAVNVWGTNIYTDDSSICTAAVHVGLITFASGGTVAIEIRSGQQSYSGTSRNGVSSGSYGAWHGSFVFVR